ncbi:hypothetical protein AB0G85_38605 [Streptomyces sioyaensis]|uniref:hypothetical protein n=1 Tax=Streptomyces sioyaensis TaxID=67364 RepID=UPI0033E27432
MGEPYARLGAELRSFGRQIDERDAELRELRSSKTPTRRKKAAESDTPEPGEGQESIDVPGVAEETTRDER